MPSVLGGLKNNPWLRVNAVVTMFDSGGSSGQLRDELGVLPPGDILKCALGEEGYQISEAGNGEEAIAKLEEIKPDLLLLDLNLPELDGWGVIRHITQHPQFKDMEVIIISGLMLDEHESATIQTHQYGFINKENFKVNNVLKQVADLLEVE